MADHQDNSNASNEPSKSSKPSTTPSNAIHVQPEVSPTKPSTSDNSASAQASAPIEIKQTTKAAAGGSKAFILHTRQSPSPTGIMTDSNGEPIPLDSIIKTASTMSSMMMAHKIALEDDFRLEPNMDISGPLMSLSPIIGSSPSRNTTSGGSSSEPSLQSRVKDIVHEAYWDLFREEIKSQKNENPEENKFELSKQLLNDIRQKIIDLLLPQHSRLKQDIEDKLDLKIIEQLSKVDSLDLLEYAKYILDVLSKLCAPVRDEKILELKQTDDIVFVYRGIMELLEMMRLDFANFTLNRFKPHIKAHSQEYEREKFNEVLKQQRSIGIDGLECTKQWLQRAVEKVNSIHGLADLLNETAKHDVDKGEMNTPIMPYNNEATSSAKVSNCGLSRTELIRNSDIVNKTLNAAYCELLEWSNTKQVLYPETLLLDEATFMQLAEQFKVLVLTSSILLTTFAFVNKFKLHENNEFKVVVKSNVITLLTASYNNPASNKSSATTTEEMIDQIKLETIATKLTEDIRQKLASSDASLLESFNGQSELFNRQILDLLSPGNRIRELARRRTLEFVETLLTLDFEHQRKKFSSKTAPPVNIPLGLNCLADELTLAMAQLVKIIRYNRRVFFQHYEDIIVELASKVL